MEEEEEEEEEDVLEIGGCFLFCFVLLFLNFEKKKIF